MAGNILRNIIFEVITSRIEIVQFCDKFETIFNLEIDKNSLEEEELKVFSDLFEVVIWYSPFPDERRTISNYVDESTVIDAAQKAAAALGIM